MPASRAAQEQFSTTPSTINDADWPAWNSSQNSSGQGFQTYDSFQLSAGSQITSVTWDGYDYYWEGHLTAPSQTTSWRVSFHANNAGVPGAALASYEVPVGNVTRTTLFNASMYGDTQTLYRDSLQLPSAFSAAAGTTYRLSIVSLQPVALGSPMYCWWPATEPGQCYVSRNFQGQQFGEPLPKNRTFRLIGELSPGISIRVGATTIASGGVFLLARSIWAIRGASSSRS